MDAGITRRGELTAGLLESMLMAIGAQAGFNGVIDIFTAKERGQIWIRKGEPLAAQWRDLTGSDALRSMAGLSQGRFEFNESTAFPARNIVKGVIPVVKPEVTALQVIRPRRKSHVNALVRTWTRRLALAASLATLLAAGICYALDRIDQWKSSGTAVVAVQPPVTIAVPVHSVKEIQDGWPSLTLSALIACGKARACAILNGQIIEVGGQVDGITVRSICANGVMLEYQGQRRFIAMEKRMAL